MLAFILCAAFYFGLIGYGIVLARRYSRLYRVRTRTVYNVIGGVVLFLTFFFMWVFSDVWYDWAPAHNQLGLRIWAIVAYLAIFTGMVFWMRQALYRIPKKHWKRQHTGKPATN